MYNQLNALCGDSKKSNTKIFEDITINKLNQYLSSILSNLTTKTFRTWKASTVFSNELKKAELTLNISDDTYKKQFCFNMANVAVGRALNHKSEITKEQQTKLDEKRKILEKRVEDSKTKSERKRSELALEKHLNVMEQKQSKIATGTSKGNYIDPRIAISWAKRTQTPIEKLYSKSNRDKFKWAMDTKSTWKF
jgi:DNA topoisomerase-1